MSEAGRVDVGILDGDGEAGGRSFGDLTLGEKPTRFLGEGVGATPSLSLSP